MAKRITRRARGKRRQSAKARALARREHDWYLDALLGHYVPWSDYAADLMFPETG